MKKVIIAGGGISGLVARYRLSKKYPDAEIVLLEKSNRLGGNIETISDPYFFEVGPRTLKASRSGALLKLIDELGLSDKILYSSPSAKKRYILKEGKLRSLPKLLSPLIIPLLTEWKKPSFSGDETISSFVERRLGSYAAKTFFDPLTLGIFAGDMRELSVSACFPFLKEMETTYGSLTKGFFRRKKGKKGLLTLEGGLQVLIDQLAQKGRGEILLNTPLDSLDHEALVLALPKEGAAHLFKGDSVARAFFGSIGSVPLTVVNIAYPKKQLKQEGFGYLVPSGEKEKVLGVVFDSSIFPAQSKEQETRLTVMLKEGGEEEALDAVKRHLKIGKKPLAISIKHYPHVVPQYRVGHLERVGAFQEHLKKNYPHITLGGNYLNGVSLNTCVEQF